MRPLRKRWPSSKSMVSSSLRPTERRLAFPPRRDKKPESFFSHTTQAVRPTVKSLQRVSMGNQTFCLVSQWGVLPDTDECYGISIVACSTLDTNRITIADGWSPHDHGSTLTASGILARQWYRQSVKEGRYVFELEPPGWFERRCALLKCSWFHALAQRMEAGQLVIFEEIQHAYRAHNDGRKIPVGTWNQLREACEKESRSQ